MKNKKILLLSLALLGVVGTQMVLPRDNVVYKVEAADNSLCVLDQNAINAMDTTISYEGKSFGSYGNSKFLISHSAQIKKGSSSDKPIINNSFPDFKNSDTKYGGWGVEKPNYITTNGLFNTNTSNNKINFKNCLVFIVDESITVDIWATADSKDTTTKLDIFKLKTDNGLEDAFKENNGLLDSKTFDKNSLTDNISSQFSLKDLNTKIGELVCNTINLDKGIYFISSSIVKVAFYYVNIYISSTKSTFYANEGTYGTDEDGTDITSKDVTEAMEKQGQSFSLPEDFVAPTRKGYKLAGWYEENDEQQQIVSTYKYGTNYYAKWEYNDEEWYIATFDVNAEKGDPIDSQRVLISDDNHTIYLPDAEDNDDTTGLLGWKIQGAQDERIYDVGEEYVLNSNVTFVAQWEQRHYADTVKFVDGEYFEWNLNLNPQKVLETELSRSDGQHVNMHSPIVKYSVESGESVTIDQEIGELKYVQAGLSTIKVDVSYEDKPEIQFSNTIQVYALNNIYQEGKTIKFSFENITKTGENDLTGDGTIKYFNINNKTSTKDASKTFDGETIKNYYQDTGVKNEAGVQIYASSNIHVKLYFTNTGGHEGRYCALYDFEDNIVEKSKQELPNSTDSVILSIDLEPGNYYLVATEGESTKPLNFYGGEVTYNDERAYVKAGYQVSKTESNSDLRLLGGIDKAVKLNEISNFGFEVTNGDQTVKRYTKTALTTLNINGESVDASTQGCALIFAYILEGVTDENVSTFQFRAYVELTNGDKIYSSEKYITPTLSND